MNPVDPRDTPMSPEAVAALPLPGFLGTLLGVLRFGLAGVLVVIGTVGILASAMVPLRVRGIRWTLWATTGAARVLLWVLGVRLDVDAPERLRAHRGFVFFNHFSWIDPVVVMAATPVRFLAAAGVRRLPLIGWIARSVGTVFVNRGNAASREAARDALQDAITRSQTPIGLAPEGGIKPGPPVRPFRHGAFEVAAETHQPVLLVALAYSPWPRAAWQDGETLLQAAWRVSARHVPFSVRVTPLDVMHPRPDDIAEEARAAEAMLNAALLA